MQRREFITLLSGTAAAWPLGARAQQDATRIRKVGILTSLLSDDLEGQERIKAFARALQRHGWVEGENLHTETRWAGDNAERYQQYAKELVGLAPDVILASTSPSVAALQRVTRDLPIIFANVVDPVGAGFVASLARPSGNTTGFIAFEYSISSKWLELLKEISSGVKRVAVVRDPSTAAGIGQFAAIQTLASSSSGLELTAIDPRDPAEIKRALAAFASESRNCGVIVTASTPAATYRDLLASLALQYRLPTVYPFRYFAANGGLASYGPNHRDIYIGAAAYVDRVLKGEKPADLPVQAPTRYELVINLKTAKALGLTVPPSLLARADEVIE
jgi:putative tryptophan/tyrosine transport system substrate-binding protein